MDFGDLITQRVRVTKGERHVELTYTVNGIPIDDGVGKELVSRITTSIKNAGECYTDSNGREMQKRQRDHRDTWTLQQTEEVAGNYFPVGTALAIRDAHAQLTVLTDRVQGGTGSVLDGTVELMVTRRVLYDDSRGVGETMNETQIIGPYDGSPEQGRHSGDAIVTRGRHFLVLTPPATAASIWRPLQDRVYMQAVPFFGAVKDDVTNVFSALSSPLPANVQIVTLEAVETDVVLLRLAHQFGVSEDASLSAPAKVKLGSLFVGRSISKIDEMALTGIALRSTIIKERINWKIDGEHDRRTSTEAYAGEDEIELGPMQIRTFRVSFASLPVSILV